MSRTAILTIVMAALAACGAVANERAPEVAVPHVRHRPRRSDVQRAMHDAVVRAAICLPRNAAPITVRGAFMGSTGTFVIDGIDANPPLEGFARLCVAQAFEAARVGGFSDAQFEVQRRFGPDGLAVSEAGPAPSSSPPPGGEGGDGTLDPGAIAREVRRQLSGIRSCYEHELRTQPDFQGRFTIHFTIGTDGTVWHAQSTTTMQHGDPESESAIKACIEGVFLRMVFPPPSGGPAESSFSFRFTLGR